MSIFFTDKLRKSANKKFKEDCLKFGYTEDMIVDFELTDKEFNNLYILFNTQSELFSDFLNNITFLTAESIDEAFDIDCRYYDVFDTTEIMEHLLHEERVIDGFMELDYRELYVIIGSW